MKSFTYERAASPEDAVRAIAAAPGAKFIAGGTNLLDLMKLQRIARIDATAAQRAPGVVLVMTHENAPKQSAPGENSSPQLASDRILHQGQPVALVIARSFEEAAAAATLVRITYATQTGDYALKSALDAAVVPKGGAAPPDTHVGDFETAYNGAPVQLDVTYTTPPHSHAMMEPHATLAVPDGDTTDPLKSKGLGELGICGAGAAIANAIYNASGVRVRDYPITLDKILSGLA